MWIRPVDAPISDTFLGHTRRKPPSTEPGIDYACGYGTRVVAPADGFVHSIKITNSGAMGRFTMVRLGPHWMRFLHGSRVPVYVGQRFRQGDTLLISGASAWGKDWGVGAHVHTTLWRDYGDRVPRPGIDMPYDFEAFLREINAAPAATDARPIIIPEPTETEFPIMATGVFCTNVPNDKDRRGVIIDVQPYRAFVSDFGDFPISYADGIAATYGAKKAAVVTEGQYEKLIRDAKAYGA